MTKQELKPIGKCVNCGELVYEKYVSTIYCSEKCADEDFALLNLKWLSEREENQ